MSRQSRAMADGSEVVLVDRDNPRGLMRRRSAAKRRDLSTAQGGGKHATPLPAIRQGRRNRLAPPWWYIAPGLMVYLLIVIIPDFQAVYYMFTDWNGISRSFHFVGWANVAAFFENPIASGGLGNTIALTIMVAGGQLLFGLLLALALNTKLKSRHVLSVVFFAPVVLTSIAVGYIWKYIFAPDGVINGALSAIGLGNWKHDWLADPDTNLWAVAFVCVWQSAGYSMAIYLAGLQSIDDALMEAAHLDGANGWQRFWNVTWPLLAPATIVNAILAVTGALKIFDQIFVMTGGGPAHTTSTLATLTYTDGIAAGNYSFGITLSAMLTVLVAGVTVIQFRMTSRAKNVD